MSYPTDPADLFAVLYDQLDERLFATDGEAEEWLHHETVVQVASLVEGEVADSGRLSTESVERYVENVSEQDRGRFAVLRGLDQAMFDLDLTTATHDQGPLVGLALRYLETGRLSTDAVEGAVVPRIVNPAQEHLLPESLREACSGVLRVPPETRLRVDHRVADSFFSRTRRDAGLFISCMPAFDRTDPFLVARVEGEVPSYRLRLEDTGGEAGWVAARLAAIDESAVHMVVLPEMALTPALLKEWQAAIRARPAPSGSRTLWIVLGSGPEHDTEGVRPHNRAVVLHRGSGDVVWEQDKQFRFQLDPGMLERWSLGDALGEGPLEEWITAGSHLVIVEAPGLRVAIFVCEDLGELDSVGDTAAAWGVSHALVPIFSQAIRRRRWEETAAGMLLQQHGIRTIVCNSKWVGDAEPDFPDDPGDALAVGDAIDLGVAEDPTDLITFRFTADGLFMLEDLSKA